MTMPPREAPISIRLTAAVREKLDAICGIRWGDGKKPNTISGIINHLLSQPLPTLSIIAETAHLGADILASLVNIRERLDKGLRLEQAQACLMSQLITAGTYSKTWSTDDNWRHAHDALRALAPLIATSHLQDYVLSKLDAVRAGQYRPQDFVDAVNLALDNWADPDSWPLPEYWTLQSTGVAKSLEVALRDEDMDVARLNEVMRPYWPGLLRLAINAHVTSTGHPLPLRHKHRSEVIANIANDRFAMFIRSGRDQELSGMITFGQTGELLFDTYADFRAFIAAMKSPSTPATAGPFSIVRLASRTIVSSGDVEFYIPPDLEPLILSNLQIALSQQRHKRYLDDLKEAYGDAPDRFKPAE